MGEWGGGDLHKRGLCFVALDPKFPKVWDTFPRLGDWLVLGLATGSNAWEPLDSNAISATEVKHQSDPGFSRLD